MLMTSSSWAADRGLLLLLLTPEQPYDSMVDAGRCFGSMSAFRTCLSLQRKKSGYVA